MPRNAVSTPGRTEGYVVPAGPSIIEKIWAELDAQTDKMMEIRTAVALAGFGEEPFSDAEIHGQKGHCLGLAKALSIILNPYDPDVNEVRREAMRRYRDKGSKA